MTERLTTFAAGDTGQWRVRSVRAVSGESLPLAAALDVRAAGAKPGDRWSLAGVTSNERYVTRPEKEQLVARQAGLGRAGPMLGALIPIRKSAAWWAMTQDERRAIFEAQSKHIQIGMDYLPAIARRLYHCRDLGKCAPFDFLTWFEYAPADETQFNALLQALRATPEWQYVEREVDIRLARASAPR